MAVFMKGGYVTVGETCEECAFQHGPTEPHNAQSVFYQIKFTSEHGRPPSWDDAMAHCDEKMKKMWAVALEDEGYPDTSEPLTGFFRQKGETMSDDVQPSERLQGEDAMIA